MTETSDPSRTPETRATPETPDMRYRRSGTSGLLLPEVTLGLWQNFGADADAGTQRAIVLAAVELGITHLDLANNYGPPPGHAERVLGEILRGDLSGHR